MRSVRHLFFVACFGLGQMVHGAAGCGGHGDRSTMLVTTAWLADHLNDPNLVILGVGQKSEYDSGHIPGSLFVEYRDVHVKGPSGLSVELPPMADLADVFGKLGVTNESHIILYQTKDWTTPTARVFVTLDAMGLGAHTAILDGGFPIWQKEGRAVSTEVRAVKRGKLEPCAQSDVITDLAFVQSNLHHPGIDVIDARMKDFYTGSRIDKRQGHIPGAGSLPFEVLLDDTGRLKPREELQTLFASAGVKSGDRVVTYCHIGQRASFVYFVARYLGYDARMYDGSWEEWSQHAELPVETPSAPK
jgi:thiosulfate/3-mercaptopyruvate sulfurtransferase